MYEQPKSPEQIAQTRLHETMKERVELWVSLITSSNLNEDNKKRFNEIVDRTFGTNIHMGVSDFFVKMKKDLHNATVYSYQTNEALALYKNIESDIDAYMTELYLS
jgi:hypothetical protein